MVPVDKVSEEGIWRLCGHQFDVDLLPLGHTPRQVILSIPEGEQGCDSAFLTWALEARPELSIAEGLSSSDLSAEVVVRRDTAAEQSGQSIIISHHLLFLYRFFVYYFVPQWFNLYQ